MALAVKLSLADRTSLRKAHRTNAAIFMDQRLFLRQVYRVVFFPHGWTPFFPWMFYELSFSALMSLFSRGALRVTVIFFIVQHLFSATSVSSCVFFPRAWMAVFPTAYISSLFSARSVLFNIRCYKPVALFSVLFCTTLKYPNFRLKSVCINAHAFFAYTFLTSKLFPFPQGVGLLDGRVG